MAKTTRRSREEVLELAKKVHALVTDGSTVNDASKRFGLAEQVYRKAAQRLGLSKKGVSVKRRSKVQVDQAVRKVHALVLKGMYIKTALEQIDVADGVYRNGVKRLGLPPPGATTGSMRADMLPPRPGKGGKRVPKPIDMDNIESIAKRLTKVNRQINDVKTLTEERKRLSTRLLHLLKG